MRGQVTLERFSYYLGDLKCLIFLTKLGELSTLHPTFIGRLDVTLYIFERSYQPCLLHFSLLIFFKNILLISKISYVSVHPGYHGYTEAVSGCTVRHDATGPTCTSRNDRPGGCSWTYPEVWTDPSYSCPHPGPEECRKAIDLLSRRGKNSDLHHGK